MADEVLSLALSLYTDLKMKKGHRSHSLSQVVILDLLHASQPFIGSVSPAPCFIIFSLLSVTSVQFSRTVNPGLKAASSAASDHFSVMKFKKKLS